MEQAGCHILCSSLRISNWFCLNKREASQDLVKDEYFLPLSAKKEKVLDCYRAVDMKTPEISGAGTKAGMHTQWEQRGWRRGETFSTKKPELTHPPLAA